MPQFTLMVEASTPKQAMEETHAAIARTLSDPIPPDLDLLNAVRAAYTAISIEERAQGRYRVIIYGGFSDILRYQQRTKENLDGHAKDH